MRPPPWTPDDAPPTSSVDGERERERAAVVDSEAAESVVVESEVPPRGMYAHARAPATDDTNPCDTYDLTRCDTPQ